MSTIEPMDITTPISFDVLSIVNESRMQYGLRHLDYQRYREYCTRRIHRLCQLLKMTNTSSKKSYQAKELPEAFTDPRYLYIYIFNTERAWAYAMELKQESANNVETRQRHHLIKRLRRAAQYSQQLYEISEKQTVDPRTVLDTKAYAATMNGYFYFEKQEWQNALDQFVEARTIYERFGNSSNAHQEALCYASMDEIDPNIQFCAYKLQLGGANGSTQDIETLVSTLKQNNSSNHLLEAQLAKVCQEQRKEKAQALAHMTWRHEQFSIKNTDLADAIVKAQTTTSSSLENNNNHSSIVEQFDQVLSDWTDAEKRIKKLLKEDKEAISKVTSSKSAKSTKELELALTYVSYHFYAYSIQRNLALMSEIKSIGGKIQNRIKLWDDILKNVDYARDLPYIKENHQFENELDILSNYYRAQRCILVALAYVDMQKTPEATALYQRAQTYVVHTKLGLQQSNGFADDSVLKVSFEDVDQLEQSIRAGVWKATASWYINNDVDMDNNDNGNNNNSIEQEITKKMKKLQLNVSDEAALIKRLNDYPSSLTGNDSSKVPHLIDFPPTFNPVSSKPFYFDLAANHIKYPTSLDDRVKSDKPSGLWKYLGY
ncbi:unnamed protein product [Cunninghamella blakesleeana]